MLGRVRGSANELLERVGTYAGWAMPARMEMAENLEDAGGEGGDAREARCAVVGKNDVLEGAFVGRFPDTRTDKGRPETLWKAEY